jgi:hypothetical protein
MKTNTKPKNLAGLCIATPTEEEFKQACEIATTNGWNVGNINKHFSDYGENTCLYFSEKPADYCQYGSRQWFVSKDYIVLTMSDLLFVAGIRENSPSESSETVSEGSYALTITNIAGDSIRCSKKDLITALDNYVKGLK